MRFAPLAAAMLSTATAAQAAGPVMMSPEWGAAACAAWNADPVLTRDLVESGWIKSVVGHEAQSVMGNTQCRVQTSTTDDARPQHAIA